MNDRIMTDTDSNTDSEPEEQDPPDYRVSHLMDDIADAFSDRGIIQAVAPFERGGIKPRVQNRVRFQYDPDEQDIRREVEQVLETERMAWTTGSGPGEIIVQGREVADVRGLRKDDRIHVHKRRGPFKVYRVMDHAPETLQRSDPAVTVEMVNTDTDTDWMLVLWDDDSTPWSYCKTKDQHAKGGFRYRKVERAERLGRMGPFRLYAPSLDHVEQGYQDTIRERVQAAADNGWLGEVHHSDVDRVLNLMTKPAAEVYSPEDADTIREVLSATADAHEREGNAMAMKAGDDEEMRELAGENQSWAETLSELSGAFNLIRMDAVDEGDDQSLWVCEDCWKAFTDKYKYPTHRRDCPRKDGGE